MKKVLLTVMLFAASCHATYGMQFFTDQDPVTKISDAKQQLTRWCNNMDRCINEFDAACAQTKKQIDGQQLKLDDITLTIQYAQPSMDNLRKLVSQLRKTSDDFSSEANFSEYCDAVKKAISPLKTDEIKTYDIYYQTSGYTTSTKCTVYATNNSLFGQATDELSSVSNTEKQILYTYTTSAIICPATTQLYNYADNSPLNFFIIDPKAYVIKQTSSRSIPLAGSDVTLSRTYHLSQLYAQHLQLSTNSKKPLIGAPNIKSSYEAAHQELLATARMVKC